MHRNYSLCFHYLYCFINVSFFYLTIACIKNLEIVKLYLCNKNQLDAPFILSLFRQSTSTYFRHICSPSSGGILYIYNNWYVLCFKLTVCWQTRPTDSQLRLNTAPSWFLLHRYIEMRGQQNVKYRYHRNHDPPLSLSLSALTVRCCVLQSANIAGH